MTRFVKKINKIVENNKFEMGSKSSSTPIMIEKRPLRNRKPTPSDKEINKINEKKFINKLNANSPKMVSDKKISETL